VSAPAPTQVMATTIDTPVPGDSPRRIRRDLRFVRWYAYTIRHVIRRYRRDVETTGEQRLPAHLLARVEVEVAAECRRMRIMFRAIVAVLLMPMVLAGLLWSGLYWLPVRIMWFPFERGIYGLPMFSVFEWLAFLMLALFLAGSLAVIVEVGALVGAEDRERPAPAGYSCRHAACILRGHAVDLEIGRASC